MDASAGVSVDEYLHTSFPDLDREYRDGELVERTLPDYLHGSRKSPNVGLPPGLARSLKI